MCNEKFEPEAVNGRRRIYNDQKKKRRKGQT